MSGQCTDQEREEINTWLDESPRHWCAFQRVGRAWSTLALISTKDADTEADPDTH
jgi:ferric-dicitrate binding protein FerR (iron transport regulator)